MRILLTTALLLLCIAPSLPAAEKDRSVAMIEAARLNLGNFKAKGGDGKLIAAELTKADSYIGRAEYALEKGKNFLGAVSESAQQEVRHLTALADMVVTLGNSKLERARVEAEAASLASRLEKVKARVKVFDDYRAEIARLKAELAKSSTASREAESLKAANASLQKQVENLSAERDLLAGQLETARKAVPREASPAKPQPSAPPEPMQPEVIKEIAPSAETQ